MTAVVIGAGPAGLAATAALARRGVPTTLVDRYDAAGGQIARAPRAGRPGTDPWAGLAGAARHPLVTHLTGTAVVALQAGPDGITAIVERDGRMRTLTADALVLATGSREVVLPFPGWTLPGVVTAGAVQAIAKREGSLPWRRIGLAGTGPLLLAVADAMRHIGHPPAFALEAQGLRHLATAGLGTARAFPEKAVAFGRLAGPHPPRFGWVVREAVGDDVLRAAVIGRTDGRGATCTITLDALAVSHALVPDPALALQLRCATRPTADGLGTAVVVDDDQATSTPGVWAAGELTGVGGADKSVAEGTVAGEAAAAHLTGAPARIGPDLRTAVARWQRFADELDRLYPVDHGWADRLPDAELLCRCEEVPAGVVRRAIADGATDPRQVKGLTRTGMGWCQGAVCSPIVRSLLHAAGHGGAGDLESRPLAAPLSLAELARLAPDAPR